MSIDIPLFIGIDIGTSGCRMIVVNELEQNIASVAEELPPSKVLNGHCCQLPMDWWHAIENLFKITLTQIDPELVRAIAVNGTSGSVLLIDEQGNPLSPCYMYNDNTNKDAAEKITAIAPRSSGAHGASSGLA